MYCSCGQTRHWTPGGMACSSLRSAPMDVLVLGVGQGDTTQESQAHFYPILKGEDQWASPDDRISITPRSGKYSIFIFPKHYLACPTCVFILRSITLNSSYFLTRLSENHPWAQQLELLHSTTDLSLSLYKPGQLKNKINLIWSRACHRQPLFKPRCDYFMRRHGSESYKSIIWSLCNASAIRGGWRSCHKHFTLPVSSPYTKWY